MYVGLFDGKIIRLVLVLCRRRNGCLVGDRAAEKWSDHFDRDRWSFPGSKTRPGYRTPPTVFTTGPSATTGTYERELSW